MPSNITNNIGENMGSSDGMNGTPSPDRIDFSVSPPVLGSGGPHGMTQNGATQANHNVGGTNPATAAPAIKTLFERMAQGESVHNLGPAERAQLFQAINVIYQPAALNAQLVSGPTPNLVSPRSPNAMAHPASANGQRSTAVQAARVRRRTRKDRGKSHVEKNVKA